MGNLNCIIIEKVRLTEKYSKNIREWVSIRFNEIVIKFKSMNYI